MGPQLGNFLPDQVRIAFDDETMVPRQILYLKLASEERKTYRPILTVNILEVQVGGNVPDQIFNYPTPPGIQERDDTETFLRMIATAAEGSTTPEP
jgi:hypothetical protein